MRTVSLCFAEDENIAQKTYFYLCPFPVETGEKVFAPVGAHNRLQRAQIVRVYGADGKDAPCCPQFLKTVAAKCGAFRRKIGGRIVYETGGLAYDEKRFTQFGRVLFGEWEGAAAGVTPVRAEDAAAALEKLLSEDGCVLLTGREAARTAQMLLLLAGVTERDACARLTACGAQAEHCSAEAVRTRLAAVFSEGQLARLAEILR